MSDKKKILYVEDDSITRGVVKMFVEKYYDIDFAEDWESAIQNAIENNYDCFLIDIALKGGLNGIEVTEKIKEIKDYANKPFIAVTAYAFPRDKQKILGSGLTHYLSKPFTSKQLLEIIEKALNYEKT